MTWRFLDHPAPFGFAHRGGTEVAPGNTLAAFDHAVRLGYTYLETDARVTSDGVLVLFHDEDLGPTTGTPGTIESKTWDEVSRLRVDGHPIPRFHDAVERYPGVRWNLEPKSDPSVDPLLAAIHDLDLLDRVGIGSFSDRRLRRVRAVLGPDVCRSPGPAGVAAVLAVAGTGRRVEFPYGCLQVPRRYGALPIVTAATVRRVHDLGLQVHVWTVNDEAEMEDLLDLGVDAIMTDRVSLLRDVLVRRGIWSNAATAD